MGLIVIFSPVYLVKIILWFVEDALKFKNIYVSNVTYG